MRIFSRLLAVMCIATCVTVQAQPAPVSVEFTLHAPDVPRGAKVYLTGGTPSLGNWAPDAVPMTYEGRDTWRVVILFSQPMTVEYRYTLGTEDRRGADSRGQPLKNFSVATRRNLEISDQVTRWTDKNTVIESPGQVTGELRFHRHVRDRTVSSRDLVVWLPRFYELRDRTTYPVLYLNDGQDLFDPLTAQDGRDWGVDEAMTRMIAEETIEPMIVVGIYSSEDRLAEYAPGEAGEDYMRFIVKTVKPLIDRRYRTRPGRESTFIGGAAMGGVIAFATAWTYPEVFGAAMSLSPAFRLDGRLDNLPWFEASAGEDLRPVFFYLDSGGQGADALLRPGVEDMVDLLQSWGYRPERNYVFIRDFDADHGVSAWGQRFPSALARSLRGSERLERVPAGVGITSSSVTGALPVAQ
jgi:enterochelin esterase-like enzyme